ncbi:response regulator [Vallitalea pronyensis]|uniref:Stage 0 sporulation protein A homolog n=1 Tax=Vallitalea pronyensis TaxID=1348613 RepID=A0A8J8MM36_9FIRM|nr:response regulator [Vallitalea pronyensis]QUI24031.1 response regulator [Vallitalea pronyensis]
MYKVLIVDDDFPVRVLLKQMIDWEEEGFEIVAEAIDGEEALEKIEFHKPDIAIVDIGMPIMNGVELIKALQERSIACKVIVLSCHDDFQYVHEAMKLGAEEYILKNLVTEERLREVLSQIKQAIQEEKREKQESQQLKRWANRGMWELKQDYLQQILRGISINKLKMEQLIQELSMGISKYNNVLLLLEIDHYEDVLNKLSEEEDQKLFNFSIRNVAEEVLQTVAKGEVLELGGAHIALIIDVENEKSEFAIKEKMNDLAIKLRGSINRYLDIQVSMVITEKSHQLFDLFHLYEKALITMLVKFYEGENHIFCTNNYNNAINHQHMLHVKLLDKRIEQYIKTADRKGIDNLLDDLSDQAIEKGITPNKVIRFWLDMHTILERFSRKYNLDIARLLDGSMAKAIQKSETIHELKHIVMDVVEEMIQYFHNLHGKQVTNESVKEVMYYVGCNYMHDITLSMVADHIQMNMAYLSHLFKQEVGESFVDYLKHIRIDKAKYLLEHTNESINSVASQVGFYDRRYFSKIFKKLEGINPTAYKRKIE